MTELARGLAGPFSVRVVCATRSDVADPGTVEVRRLPCPVARTAPFGRLIGYLHFLWKGAREVARAGDDEVLVLWTDPPLQDLVLGLVCRLLGKRFVVTLQDVYPEVVAASGLLPSGLLAPLRWMRNRVLAGADAVVCISPDTAELLGASLEFEHIANWSSGELGPAPDARARRWGQTPFRDRTIVKYAGNVGYACDLASFEQALARLERPERFLFVFQVSGRKRAAVEELARRYPTVQLEPQVPREHLAESLSACDAHLILTPEAMFGVVYASKVYSAIAVGVPVVASIPARSAMRQLIAEHGLGFSATAGDPASLVSALESLHAARDTSSLAKLNGAVRAAAPAFSAQRAIASYAALFVRLSQERKPPGS